MVPITIMATTVHHCGHRTIRQLEIIKCYKLQQWWRRWRQRQRQYQHNETGQQSIWQRPSIHISPTDSVSAKLHAFSYPLCESSFLLRLFVANILGVLFLVCVECSTRSTKIEEANIFATSLVWAIFGPRLRTRTASNIYTNKHTDRIYSYVNS